MSYDFPSSPANGQIFVAGGITYVYNGQGWVSKGVGAVTISDAPPANPIVGQLWWESDSGNMFIWFNDGTSAQWVHVSGFAQLTHGAGGGIAEAPVDGTQYVRKDTAWQPIDIEELGTGIPEAPTDGKQYVRQNGAWVEVSIPPSGPWFNDVNGDAILKFGGVNIMVRVKPTGLILTKDDIEIFSTSV